MANNTKNFALNGGHTAGIFADMTVDGPVIGTLVAVVDRAKNLPNRKTIGKQDPYCAARLGKEAKKTTTDIRGGQTPKWDQELRFTVHDSPDYYQLKMSIFTDDKKTDLIGEAWIDLKGIIIAGGGQNDMWQGLTCKGKYAGEIRLEITFYDSRPRPERATVRNKQHSVTEKDVTGSTSSRTPVKRRPLPLDPITGEATSDSPVSIEQPNTPRSITKSASQPAFIPTQSPLQSIEYGTPPHGARQPVDQSNSSPHSVYRQGHRATASHGSPLVHASSFDQLPELADDSGLAISYPNGATPPPPPAHRSTQSSVGPDHVARNFHDVSPQKSPVPMRQDVLRSEAHRHTPSAPAYPGQPVFKPYEPSLSGPASAPLLHDSPHGSPSIPFQSQSPRSSPSHSPRHRFMQPTVEDAPDTPGTPPRYNTWSATSSPAHRSPGSQDQYMRRSPQHAANELPGRHSRSTSVSPLSAQDGTSSSPQPSYAFQPYQEQRLSRRSDYELSHSARHSPSHDPPPVPLSLSPGVDLALSQDFAHRPVDHRSYEHPPVSFRHSSPTRGRHRSEGPPSSFRPPPSYMPQPNDGRSVVRYFNGPDTHAPGPKRSPSPNPSPQHQIRRKSLSPAPPPSENRGLSDIPFGPDSYDALNPSLSTSSSGLSQSEPLDPDAKIITHDGREVDPSDHLPMESWAPEPEPKIKQAPPPEPRSRPSPSGAQPMPPSGRRPLRVVARPVAMATQPPLPAVSYGQLESVRSPPVSGHTRLQNKLIRASAGHATHASVSSPLAPLAADNYQGRQAAYVPTRRRGLSFDFPSENYAPYYGTGPPIPAKVPLALMSGANAGVETSLLEEMQAIDIGAGRSRRRGGY